MGSMKSQGPYKTEAGGPESQGRKVLHCGISEWRKPSGAEECRWPLEAGEAKDVDCLLQSPEEPIADNPDFSQ